MHALCSQTNSTSGLLKNERYHGIKELLLMNLDACDESKDYQNLRDCMKVANVLH